MNMRNLLKVFLLALGLAVTAAATAEAPEMADNHPVDYVVQDGDTLWGLSGRFLKDPWRWKEIWRENPNIKNPDLIYPGDRLVLRYDENGAYLEHLSSRERAARKTVKMTPAVYIEQLDRAIPAIPPGVIMPFLTDPRIIEEGGLNDAPYITEGLQGNIIMGQLSEVYARKVDGAPGSKFKVLRKGDPLIDPESKKVLAYETVYLGEAEMLRPGDPAKMMLTRAVKEVQPGDRLIPITKKVSFPYYQPETVTRPVNAYIMSTYGALSETAIGEIVTISVGDQDGIRQGDVLQIMRNAGLATDPVTKKKYERPVERSGVLMVFKTFDRVSYALIMRSTQAIHVNDRVVNFN
jgi:hypothetical protein